MSRMRAQAPMQAGSGLGSPGRRADVWFAPDCVRGCVRTCAIKLAWVAPTVLTVMSVLTIPVLAQQPNRQAIDAHVMTTHLRGATGSEGWRAAQLKQSADTTLLKLAQATISNTERSRQALAADRRFVDVRMRQYDWDQTYSAADFRKLMVSYSGTQMMDEADRNGLLDDIESFVHEQFQGTVTRPLVVTLTTARLA